MIKLLSAASVDLEDIFNISQEVAQEGAKLLNIPRVQIVKTFIDKTKYSSTIEGLEIEVNKCYNTDGIVVYQNLYKNHPTYEYFHLFYINSHNINNFRNISKIHKLKAFL